MADKWKTSFPGQSLFNLTMIQQLWLLCATLECIFLCVSGAGQSVIQRRRCAFQAKPNNMKYSDISGDVNGSEQLCYAHIKCCVGYFLLVNGQLEVDLLTCDGAEDSCPDTTCQVVSTHFDQRLTKCVCSADMCNSNVNISSWKPKPKPNKLTHSNSVDKTSIYLIGVPIGALLLLSSILAVVKLRHLFKENDQKRQPSPQAFTPLCSCHRVKKPQIEHADIELQQIVGRGHFASVWRGNYRGSVVAVKVFPTGGDKEFFIEEEIHELPLMDHSAIVHFLGAVRNHEGGQWLMVLELAACGSLQSFLCNTMSNWISTMKLSQSLSQGVSYLHSDLHRHGVHKPAVAHRDLSSSNVLVRADGTCALSDFGCSTVLSSCPGHHNWPWPTRTVQGCVHVGTLRYMSPEILEGLVNLSSGQCLMQGDVYSLGLLLWEICMRCTDLFEDNTAPEHCLPYETELGVNVTLEELVLYVSQMNQRPSIPKHWEQFQGPSLQELMMECWDHEPDARLTAPCVVDRLHTLQSCCTL